MAGAVRCWGANVVVGRTERATEFYDPDIGTSNDFPPERCDETSFAEAVGDGVLGFPLEKVLLDRWIWMPQGVRRPTQILDRPGHEDC